MNGNTNPRITEVRDQSGAAGACPQHKLIAWFSSSTKATPVQLGNVVAAIPPGTSQAAALDAAALFTSSAKTLATAAAMYDDDADLMNAALWSVTHLLDLASALIASGHSAQHNESLVEVH